MRTLHLVSHTHWDREWYLTFQQFRMKLVHLIDGLLDILDRDPVYKHFMLDGQTIVLDDYLAVRPEREEALRKYIQQGRILVGPWHILPDEFLVSAEATIRNLLQGDRTCRRFGPKMRIGYIPDPFGHIGQMPQILNQFGISYAAFRRGLSDEPCEVWWESPDGSRVLTSYLREGYDNAASLPTSERERFISEVRRLRDNLLPHTHADDLLLLQGTDHMEPPPDTPQAIAFAEGKLDGDRLVHSTLQEYMSALQVASRRYQFPVIRGELRDSRRHHLLPGVLSTRMWIKQQNNACETLLEKWAEPFSSLARWGLHSLPPSSLVRTSGLVREAWQLLMQNHPHDSICGCSIDQVHEEMRTRFAQAAQIGEEVTRQSLEAIAEAVDTHGKPDTAGLAVVVFNPWSMEVSDVASVTLELPLTWSGFDLIDGEGNILPYQLQGLGSREIVNLTLSPRELQSSLGQIHEGRAAGLTVQEVRMERQGSRVTIEAFMDDGGEPNLGAWNRCLDELKQFMANPEITAFVVHMRYVAATRLIFTAEHIPGLGYRTFWVRPKDQTAAPIRINPLLQVVMPLGTRLAASAPGQALIRRLGNRSAAKSPPRIENEFLAVTVHKDGTLSLEDKASGAVYSGLNQFLDGGDCGDEYNYAPPAEDLFVRPRLVHVDCRRGPVEQTLELRLEMKTPICLAQGRKSRSKQYARVPILTRIRLMKGIARVDIQTEVDNRARDHRLRVHFPAPFAAYSISSDGHFEVVRRPLGLPAYDATWIEQPRPEVPQRAFTDISDGRLGLMIANRGLPEVEVLKNRAGHSEIALTLLRCIGWLSRDDFSTRRGHAGPMLATPLAQMPGRWTFDYAVIPHPFDWQSAWQRAYAFQAPLRAAAASLHSGDLPSQHSLVSIEPAEFILSAVKETEDGQGWLVRGYNLGSEPLEGCITPGLESAHAEQVNLAEEKMEELRPNSDRSITLRVLPHKIASVLFRK